MGYFAEKYSNQIIVSYSISTLGNDMKRLRDMLVAKAEATGLSCDTGELDVNPQGEVQPVDTKLLQKVLEKLTTETRLYLIGHGDWVQQTMGGLGAEIWAKRMIACGLRKPPKVISIVGCNAAVDRGLAVGHRLAESMNSFASQFHCHLKKLGGIEAFLFARPYTIRSYSGAENKKTTHKYEGPFKKDLSPKDDERHHGQFRKVCFYWEAGWQRRKWVEYGVGGKPGGLVAMDAERDFGAEVLPEFDD